MILFLDFFENGSTCKVFATKVQRHKGIKQDVSLCLSVLVAKELLQIETSML